MALSSQPLFVYGTLRDPDVLAALLGRAVAPQQAVPARAPGFRAVHYPRRVYPALIAARGSNAPGLLLHDLSAVDLAVLDAFEGDEYRRGTVSVLAASDAVRADAYLPAVAIPADAEPWTLENWTLLHKQIVLDGERRSAEALRERLSAAGGRLS